MKGLLELEEFKEVDRTNLMLVDCMNLAFRYKRRGDSDFAANFLSTIDSLGKSYAARTIVLLADWKYSKFRKEKYPQYKEGRKERYKHQTEEEKENSRLFFEGYEKALELASIKYPLLRFEYVEADDLAAYVVQELEPYFEHTWLISTDGDWDLLLSDNVSRFSFKNRKEYYMNNFYEEHGCDTPEQLLSVKVIQGDKKDSVDGINGVGVKRAYTLTNQYGSAYDLVDAMPLPGKQVLTQRINEAKDMIYMNYELLDLRSFCSDAIAYPNSDNLDIIKEFCDKYKSK